MRMSAVRFAGQRVATSHITRSTANMVSLPASHHLRTRVTGASPSAGSVLAMQHRYQFYTDPAKRDHEAFLATYDPLQVLGLPEDATAREVHEAAERKKAQYAVGAKEHNKQKLETVERAYDLLKDISSPYYTKAGSGDRYRHRLQVDMLPAKNKKMVQFQMLVLCIFVGCGILMILKQILLPMQKSLRAATR